MDTTLLAQAVYEAYQFRGGEYGRYSLDCICIDKDTVTATDGNFGYFAQIEEQSHCGLLVKINGHRKKLKEAEWRIDGHLYTAGMEFRLKEGGLGNNFPDFRPTLSKSELMVEIDSEKFAEALRRMVADSKAHGPKYRKCSYSCEIKKGILITNFFIGASSTSKNQTTIIAGSNLNVPIFDPKGLLYLRNQRPIGIGMGYKRNAIGKAINVFFPGQKQVIFLPLTIPE